MEINGKAFEALELDQKFRTLFTNVEEMYQRQESMDVKLDTLLGSPWRMAIPPVSWKAIGVFTLALVAIARGDLATFGKLIGTLVGIGG